SGVDKNGHFFVTGNYKVSQAVDIYGCAWIKSKFADTMVDFWENPLFPSFQLLAGEITFRNGDFSDALTVAATLIHKWTNVVYVLSITLHENTRRCDVDAITFILMKRNTQIAELTNPNRA